MPITTPTTQFVSLEAADLTFVVGGCGKKKQQCCPPPAAPPPPAAAPPPAGGDQISTNVSITGY